MDVQSDQDASEQLSDSFVCCVCLDLLYKPIVLSCGHVACFWCVHISMNGFRESHCPICRSPYYHFPTVCQMLHFLLVKMYPLTYKRRQKQVLEEEKKMGSFSPDFDRNDQKLSSTSLNLHSNREGDDSVNTEELDISSGSCEQVSVADLSCVSCKQLLFRPVVLNCGHVYCETCIVIPEDDTLKCEVCESPHPRGFPKVCLELHHFLEEKFPTEYALRKNTAQLKKVPLQQETQTTCKSTKSDNVTQGMQFRGEGNILPWWGDQASNIHIGAGCDSCGMYPIIGDRYRCKDCVEAIGFDLCGNCYNTRSKLPGRFNQQHTPEHRFENIKNSVHEFMLTLWNSQPENGLNIPVLTSEEQELVETLPALNEQVSDRVDNDLIDPNNNSSDDQTESQNSQPPSRAI